MVVVVFVFTNGQWNKLGSLFAGISNELCSTMHIISLVGGDGELYQRQTKLLMPHSKNTTVTTRFVFHMQYNSIQK